MFDGRRGNGDVRRLALAGIGAGAARLVNRVGEDLQDRRQTRRSAIASSTAHVRKQAITHGLHDALREDDRTSSSCLDVNGLENEYDQGMEGILYLS